MRFRRDAQRDLSETLLLLEKMAPTLEDLLSIEPRFEFAYAWHRDADGCWTYAKGAAPRWSNTVYAFVSGNTVTYLGQAKHLWRRHRSGHRKSFRLIFEGVPKSSHHIARYREILGAAEKSNALSVWALRLDSGESMSEHERQLIAALQPRGNSETRMTRY